MSKVLKQQWSYFNVAWETRVGDVYSPNVHISDYFIQNFIQLESNNRRTQDLIDKIYYLIDDLWHDIDVAYMEGLFATQEELEKEVTRLAEKYWQEMKPYIRALEKAEKDGML